MEFLFQVCSVFTRAYDFQFGSIRCVFAAFTGINRAEFAPLSISSGSCGEWYPRLYALLFADPETVRCNPLA